MKLTIKLFLTICLFCSVALAGDMEGGGLAGDIGNDIECTKCFTDIDGDKDGDSILDFINSYLSKLLR